MIINSLMATLHHLCAFTLTACLIYEFAAYRKGLGVEEARRIQRIDTIYGIASGLLIVVGLLRVFYFEKGSNYYFHNYLYWTKMALFVIVGLLSIYPTVRFIKWNGTLKENLLPEISDDEFKRTRLLLGLELVGIALILFAAPMIARGIGMM
jgi:putative membrane protein